MKPPVIARIPWGAIASAGSPAAMLAIIANAIREAGCAIGPMPQLAMAGDMTQEEVDRLWLHAFSRANVDRVDITQTPDGDLWIRAWPNDGGDIQANRHQT